MATRKPTKSLAEALIPTRPTLSALKAAAADCKACDLWKKGTQTVFGDGSRRANVLFIGEQPGNEEDLTGKPFVGPAGKLFDKALEDAGIDRKQTYVTNVVKHFKWEPRGKRRIHKKPRASEIKACRPWLEAELRAVQPAVVVCLGATAAQSVLGASFKLMKQRGQLISSRVAARLPTVALAEVSVVATIHPSAVLRAPDSEGRRAAYEMLVADLKVVAKALR